MEVQFSSMQQALRQIREEVQKHKVKANKKTSSSGGVVEKSVEKANKKTSSLGGVVEKSAEGGGVVAGVARPVRPRAKSLAKKRGPTSKFKPMSYAEKVQLQVDISHLPGKIHIFCL